MQTIFFMEDEPNMSLCPLELIHIGNGKIVLRDEMGEYHEYTAEEALAGMKEIQKALFEYRQVTGKLIGEGPT